MGIVIRVFNVEILNFDGNFNILVTNGPKFLDFARFDTKKQKFFRGKEL